MIDVLVEVPLQRPIAAGRIGIQAAPRLDRKIGRFLHRLHREIFGRVDDHSSLPTDPGDNRWPVFVVMAPPGLAFLAAPTWSASQHLLPALLGLPLVAGGLVEVIRFHRAFQLAVHLIREDRIPEPPAPAVAGPTMDAQLSGNPPRRTRQTEQKGGEKPVGEGTLAA